MEAKNNHSPSEKRLHENIKAIRELRNFSQEHMAMCLKISQSEYSRIENGRTHLTTARLDEIAKVLKITSNQIQTFDILTVLPPPNKIVIIKELKL